MSCLKPQFIQPPTQLPPNIHPKMFGLAKYQALSKMVMNESPNLVQTLLSLALLQPNHTEIKIASALSYLVKHSKPGLIIL